MNENKKFPYSEEAEKYILGCMLLDPTVVDQTLSEITSDDFYVRANKNVMIAIESLAKENVTVDQLKIVNEL